MVPTPTVLFRIQLMQATDPGQLGLDLPALEDNHFGAINPKVHRLLQYGQSFVPGSQKVLADAQNAGDVLGRQHLEQTDARAKRVFRSRVLLAKFPQPLEQRAPPEWRDGVLLARLSP